MQTVITGTGSFVPPVTKCNKDFVGQAFYDENQKLITRPGEEIIEKFEVITGICERRYSPGNTTASFMGMLAAKIAIDDAGIDAETIDQVIVAHNFGDTGLHAPQSSMVPSLASRIKKELGIKAPGCVAYDILFGCPGWLQGLIQADAFGKAGVAKTCLVIGTETLSRVLDVYDRDSMIYSDGAGAVVTQIQSSPEKKGMLKSVSASFTKNEADFIYMGASNNPAVPGTNLYLKMQGRKVYEFALKQVPAAIKQCLDKNEIHLEQIKKIFIHQANQKMDEAIVCRLFELYGLKDIPSNIMPMNINAYGNSSVATIPTLFDMVRRSLLLPHSLSEGDLIVFASVGAGMNINAVCYRV